MNTGKFPKVGRLQSDNQAGINQKGFTRMRTLLTNKQCTLKQGG